MTTDKDQVNKEAVAAAVAVETVETVETVAAVVETFITMELFIISLVIKKLFSPFVNLNYLFLKIRVLDIRVSFQRSTIFDLFFFESSWRSQKITYRSILLGVFAFS